eukprot:m.62538 g.62538  ORF g.62538 m.62538 type:complete len:306 (+) comp8095_c0_seq3:125-1042(+)
MSQARSADVRTLQGTHVGMGTNEQLVLRSRVEQQSELIMMLKTHNDNMSRELRDLEKSRAAALEAATRADRERADLGKRYTELDDRFHLLASNHKETVVFMEEHKADKERLSARLSELTSSLSSLSKEELEAAKSALEAAEAKAAAAQQRSLQLETRVSTMTASRAAVDKRMATAEARSVELTQQLNAERTRADAAEKSNATLKVDVAKLESRLSTATSAVERVTAELSVIKAQVSSNQAEIAAVTKERDSLQKEIAELQQRLGEGGHAELAKVQKEYHAYKRYSTQLLQKEKEVNARLRHLGHG